MVTYPGRIAGRVTLWRAEYVLSAWVYAAARILFLGLGLELIVCTFPRCQNHIITDLVSPAETYAADHQLNDAYEQ